MEDNLDVSALNEQFKRLQTENFELSESLSNISMMLDSQGWNPIYEAQKGGMLLEDLKRASLQLRELAVGNPLIKRGAKLRSSYVWSRGVNMPRFSARIRNKMFTTLNERYIFSPEAYEELEMAAYTDGNVFLLGNDSDNQFMRVPLEEISGVMTDPDNKENIWAVRRTWKRKVGITETEIIRWYYTDNYPTNRRRPTNVQNSAGVNETADTSKTMFYQSFNRQVGWTFGVPDAISVIAWAKLYREFLENGAIMTKALAQFAYKLSSKGRGGISNAAAKIATPDGQANRVGATAAMGSDVDLVPMPRAGAGYDFESGKSLASMIAAGLEVSVVALLADPGSSGSYGTAQTLDTPTQKAMEVRQRTWGGLFKRVVRYMGAQGEIDITWPSIETEPTHRMVQALAMAWESGVLQTDEYRTAILDILDIVPVERNAPRGIMMPNNTEYTQTKSNDGQSDSSSDSGVVPSQGNSGSVGALADGDNELRDSNL
jgi:hypothetical protein